MAFDIARKGGFSMGRKQYTEEQIAFALRQAESRTPVAEIIRPIELPLPEQA